MSKRQNKLEDGALNFLYLQSQAATVSQAERGLAIAEARYKAGQGAQLEILDAQLVLLQVRTGYAQVRLDRSMAALALEQAVGVLGEE